MRYCCLVKMRGKFCFYEFVVKKALNLSMNALGNSCLLFCIIKLKVGFTLFNFKYGMLVLL